MTAAPAARRRRRGVFVTFEGGEGSGKSTQARLLHERLAAAGRDAVLTREPGGTRVGELIRGVLLDPGVSGMDPLSELFLYLSARRQHLAGLILPALERGAVVICDRFADATLAYQGAGRGLDRRLIRRLNLLATGGIEPDCTVLIRLGSVEEGLRRARARDRERGADAVSDRFEREALDFHRRVDEGYLRLARRHPGRIGVVDGEALVEVVRERVLSLLRRSVPGEAWE